VQFVVNNAKRLMNPASVAGGIADALTFNLFDFDKENKKAAGGPVEMAAGGAMQFGSHPDMLGMVGGLYLKAIVGSFGAFGFVGNKVKSSLAPDIQKIAGGLGVQVSTGGGGTAGGVSNSVQFQAPQSEKKKVENIKNLSYKENTFIAISEGLNKLLINGIKIFDPQYATKVEQQRGAGQTPSSGPAPSSARSTSTSTSQEVEGGWSPVLNLILKYESGSGGYDAMYPGTTLPGASKMPIGQVARQATGAVGAWQNLPEYLNQRAVAVGLDPKTDLYNAENQQKIAEYLIGPGQAQVSKQMAKENPKEAMLRLSRVWAAIPKDDGGASFYAGDGVNVAHIKPDMMYDAFQQLAKGGKIKKRPKQGAYSEDRMSGGENGFSAVRGYAKGGKIFLHWTGGGYSAKYKNKYHSIVQGDGSIFKAHPYDQRSGVAHTYLRNSQGIGMSIAAMGGDPDYWTVPVKDVQIEGLAKEIANAAKAWGWNASDINIKNVMTHAEAAAGKDGQLPRNDNYGPTMWGGDGTRWDLLRLTKGGEDGSGGNILRAKARGYMGGDSTVKETDGSSTSSSSNSSNSGGGDTSTQSSESKQSAKNIKPEKPKTLEEMLEAFKTGLTSALTKISTNVSKDNPTKSAGDLPGNPVTTSTVSTSKITQMASSKEKAVTKLKTIRDKAQRDEQATILPIVTERLVIQKVKQTINTGGGTSAVYTSPSPLLSQ
jgi:hypothetical protein